MKPILVILAAGASRRLGACKATALLAGTPAILHLLRAAHGLTQEPPLVVTGKHDEEIARILPPDCDRIYNENWEQGRCGSLAAALRIHPERDVIVAPVDVPLIPRSVFEALIAEWQLRGSPPEGWLAPRLQLATKEAGQGATQSPRYGHPVLLGRRLARSVLSMPADTPLRELRSLASPLLSLAVEAQEILDDIDEPSDLDRIRARLAAP